MVKADKVYYEECGKGDVRRKEDLKAIKSNWDKIDWSKKEISAEENKQTEKE